MLREILLLRGERLGNDFQWLVAKSVSSYNGDRYHDYLSLPDHGPPLGNDL
jgi:hypothetical protein